MTDTEWEKLRAALCQQFGEDIVQQVLLELLEEQVKGVVVINPLHWCRMRAKSRTNNLIRSAVRERQVKEALSAFEVTSATLSRQAKDRIRKRRKRRKAAA